MEIKYTVEEKYDGLRINDILGDYFGFSRLLRKRIRLHGKVFKNQKPARMIDLAHTGDCLLVIPAEEDFPPSFLVNRLEHVPILYEDEHIVVVNKPANLVVHPTFTHPNNTLLDILSDAKLHAVTRLDRETSGAMVLAKHGHAHFRLMNFPMKRIYLGLTHGIWSEKSGLIDFPLERAKDSIMIRIVDSQGKKALTHYNVLKESKDLNISLVEFYLETGRTHQIRVHSLYSGHPLIADGLYGIADYFSDYKTDFVVPPIQKDLCRIKKENQADFLALLNQEQFHLDCSLKRQALHARILGLTHPITNQYMEFEAAMPDDFLKIFPSEWF